MFSQAGFLGTEALWFMDATTIYFAILPFLLLYSVQFAINNKYKEHLISQSIILSITLFIVVVFEVGVRLSGGFLQYAKQSVLPFDFLLSFLIVHIFIALFAVCGWLYLFISTLKLYKKDKLVSIKKSKHKKIGKAIFASLCLSSLMGIFIYIFLFVFIK